MSYAFDMDSILMKLDQRRTAAKRDQDILLKISLHLQSFRRRTRSLQRRRKDFFWKTVTMRIILKESFSVLYARMRDMLTAANADV